MPLVLGLQALMFAAPYAAWTLWEGGLVSGCLGGLRLQEVLPGDQRLRAVRLLARSESLPSSRYRIDVVLNVSKAKE